MLFATQSLAEMIPFFRQEIWTGIMVIFFVVISVVRSLKMIALFSLLADICIILGVVLLIMFETFMFKIIKFF
jgi:hypothetical protein